MKDNIKEFKIMIGKFQEEMKSNSITDLVVWLECKHLYFEAENERIERENRRIKDKNKQE